jgi:hypothetical protein
MKVLKDLAVSGSITVGQFLQSSINTDKFLVSESGVVKYRSGSQLLGDIGAAASGHTHTFASLTSKPTTLSGYGITDAVSTATTITINGTTYDLSANRSWTVTTSETDTLASVTGRGATTSTETTYYGGLRTRKSQTAGNYTTAALWTESYDNTATGIAFHISGVKGTFLEMRTNQVLYWDGNTVYHSGNLTNLNQLSNGPGYITGYTETDTLASVTGRGASTSTAIIFSNSLAVGHSSHYDSTQFSLDINGGLLVKNTGKTAQFTLINANPASGGNAGFVQHTVGGTITGAYAAIQTYYGASVAAGTLQLQPSGGIVTIGGSTVFHAGNYTSYSPTLTGGGASGTWGINITGNAATLGGYSPNQTGGVNTIVQRDANGYIQNSYFYMSGGGSERNSSGLGYIAGFNSSDYYVRSYNSTAVASFLGLGSMAYASTGSYLALSGGTMTGQILGPSIGSDVYGGAIQIRERGYVLAAQSDWSYSPAITFHWGNRWAKRFGGRYDGLFAIDDEPIALRSWVSSQGYITGYTETDTLASVTARGASTSTALALNGKVTFSSTVANRPQFPGGILGLDTSDGNFDIWGISRDYYPSHATAANAWGLRWNGDNNDFEFVGGGTNRVILDMDGGNITTTGKISIGTTYAGFGANIAGTVYVIGGQIYVNDGYQIQNTSGNAIIQFASSSLVFTGSSTFNSAINVSGRITASAGSTYAVSGSSSQRYIMQALNTSNSVNASYGWWWFHNTNGDMGFHADGIGDILTLTRGGGFTINGNTVLTAGNYNSYSPTLTGGNASGTWSINVTGSAGSSGQVTHNSGRADGTYYNVGWFAGASSPAYSCDAVQIQSSTGTLKATSINAPSGYVSIGNPWSTANSAYFPNGITTAGGDNWIYGHTYVGNAPTNGSGHEFWSNGSSYHRSNVGTSSHGSSARFLELQSASGNFIPYSFESDRGNHSWGTVARFRINNGESDRPSIQFSWGGSDNRWNVGYCYADDNFRITQNMGYRNDNSTTDGWGSERFKIDTSGNITAGGSIRTSTYLYASGNVRVGDMWSGNGLYVPSGIMVFGTENEGWRFSMAADQKAYIGTDGNIWMKWAGDYISNLLGAKQNSSTAITTSNIGSQSVTYATRANYLDPNYNGNISYNPQSYFNNGVGVKVAMTGAWSVWSDTLWINGYTGGDVPSMCALHFLRNGTPRMAISTQTHGATSYGAYYEVITSYNIAGQSVSYASTAGSASSASYASSAGSVAWGNVSSKPADWLNQTNLTGEIAPNTAMVSGFYNDYAGSGNPTGTWMSFVNVRHSNPNNNYGHQHGMSFYDNTFWFRSYAGGVYQSWAYAISSQNIASQSVSYASSAGNASTLAGYGWASSGKDIRGAEIFTDSWLRNYNVNTGLYNQSSGNHFYSGSANYWNITGNNTGSVRLQFRNTHESTLYGSVYGEAGNIGFLANDGNWGLRIDASKTVTTYGNKTTKEFGGSGSYGGSHKWNLFLGYDAGADETWLRVYLQQGYAINANDVQMKIRVVWNPQHASFAAYQELEVMAHTTYWRPPSYCRFSGVKKTKCSDFGGGTYYGATSTPNVDLYDNNDGYLYIRVKGKHDSQNVKRTVEVEMLGQINGTPTLETCSAPSSGSFLGETYQLDFQTGNLYVSGDVTAYYSSDRRLKDNVINIDNPIDKLMKLNGVTFDWNDKQQTYEVGSRDYGVIAQDVEEVMPELVRDRDNGYKGVRYEKMIPLLIESIKEQQGHIAVLKKQIEYLVENK